MNINISIPSIDIQSIKTHIYENRNAYYALGVGIAIGVVVGALCAMDDDDDDSEAMYQPLYINNTNAPIFNNDNSSAVNLGGHAQKIVQKDSTGETWLSNKAAAEAEGVSPHTMSMHTNGHTEDIYGETYSIVGLCISNGIY